MQYREPCIYMVLKERRAWMQVVPLMASRPPPKMFARTLGKALPLAKPLILCIEDDLIYLTLRKAVLEREGYDVIGLTSAAEALETLRESPVCCVIADHMLQGQTGTQLAQEMKNLKSEVPIILFSGTNPATLHDIDVYVNKGGPTATFLSIVRGVVDRFRGTSQSPSPMLPSSAPSKLAEILEFPNAPEESHVSQWVKMGDEALADNGRKKK
jgi:CheY-like chemotaxis protein